MSPQELHEKDNTTMEVLAVIGIIILVAILFVAGGLSGHLSDAIGRAFSFLADGCMKWVGACFGLYSF